MTGRDPELKKPNAGLRYNLVCENFDSLTISTTEKNQTVKVYR